jgi:hypothetical protein
VRRRLGVAIVLALAVAAPAGSTARTISIQSTTRVAEGWQQFEVYGLASGAKPGDSIDVEAFLCDGYGIWQSIAKTEAAPNGAWVANISVVANAKLRARSSAGVSNTISVAIHPHVLLQAGGRDRYSISVNANSFFDGRRGLLERLSGTRWFAVRSFTLHGHHSVGVAWSTARVRAHVKRGTLLRALLPKSQVGRCYLAGFSNQIRA